MLLKFQSTHPRGVRRAKGTGYITFSKNFNPRTREGCDRHNNFACPSITNFNPRTREGCDSKATFDLSTLSYFNPRTREGCDSVGDGKGKYGITFQSTHPRGVRLKSNIRLINTFLFQSTHPRGVRLCWRRKRKIWDYISIHAPARGATKGRAQYVWKLKISIHAPARGATTK